MIKIEKVQGSQNEVPKLEINIDTVYLRDNIVKKSDDEGNSYWEYDEIQMTLNEYFKKIIPDNEKASAELSLLFSTYQAQVDAALAELSILVGGKDNV